MKNSSYYIAPVGDRTHDLPHTVASNMVKVSNALNHSATEAEAFKDDKRQGKMARSVGDKLLVEGHFVTPNTSQHAYDMPGEHSYMHDYVCVC